MKLANPNLRSRIIAALMVMWLAIAPQSVLAAHHEKAPVEVDRSYVDAKRGIKASQGFAGSETRRIDLKVWYPADNADGPHPLIIYSHGTFGFASNAMHFVKTLVDAGYVVAAPNYPLTSRNAHTKVKFADITDVHNQVKDISFIIDSLLADPELGPMIDAEKIGTTGHSLGAVTSYFATYAMTKRDPRIKALVPIAGGDPVQTALDNGMGMGGSRHAEVSVPVLFLSADRDVFARMTGRPHTAYSRVEGPKYELLIKNGVHVWFRDGTDQPEGNKNPDCIFFETNMPGMNVPGCDERVPLIGPERQQEITRMALVTFFDAYLKGDEAALARLQSMGEGAADFEMIHSD